MIATSLREEETAANRFQTFFSNCRPAEPSLARDRPTRATSRRWLASRSSKFDFFNGLLGGPPTNLDEICTRAGIVGCQDDPELQISGELRDSIDGLRV